MSEGYLLEELGETFCSDACLDKKYPGAAAEMDSMTDDELEESTWYWTSWEEEKREYFEGQFYADSVTAICGVCKETVKTEVVYGLNLKYQDDFEIKCTNESCGNVESGSAPISSFSVIDVHGRRVLSLQEAVDYGIYDGEEEGLTADDFTPHIHDEHDELEMFTSVVEGIMDRWELALKQNDKQVYEFQEYLVTFDYDHLCLSCEAYYENETILTKEELREYATSQFTQYKDFAHIDFAELEVTCMPTKLVVKESVTQ